MKDRNEFIATLAQLSDVWLLDVDSAFRHVWSVASASTRLDTLGAWAAVGEEKQRNSVQNKRGRTVVLPLMGVISQYGGFWGGTSTNAFGRDFDAAMASDSVASIIIAIDSPGGTVPGVQELAAKIHAARGLGKQIVSVACPQMASAAYWIGAAADELYVQPSGSVGSVGVWTAHEDWSKADEKIGIRTTLVVNDASPYKVEANPWSPLDPEARAELQRGVNATASEFIVSLARYRRTSPARVTADFGKGRMMRAEAAVQRNMADGIASLERVVQRLSYGLPVIAGKQERGTVHASSNDPFVLRKKLEMKMRKR
jgi:signal peptide peptidase SppA